MTSQQTPLPNGAGEKGPTTRDAKSAQPQASSSGAETSSPTTEPPKKKDWSRAHDGERASAITDLLDGADRYKPGDEQDPTGTDDAGDDPWLPEQSDELPTGRETGPSTLTDLAEQLGMDADEAYKITITTGDGEAVSLGDLKDAYQSREADARESAKRGQSLDERESALIADNSFLSEIAQEIKGLMKPDTLEKVTDRLQRNEAQERQKLMAAMPELVDDDVAKNFKTQFAETLLKYGYKPNELHITDHRQVLIVRDLMRTKARLQKLLDFKPDAKPPRAAKPNGRGGNANRQSQLIAAAKKGHEGDKVAAISHLIKGR